MGEVSAGGRRVRRTIVVVAGLLALTVAVVAAVIVFFSAVDEESASENPFPPYWNELEEGQLTRQELVDRLGRPTGGEAGCLVYDNLVESEAYRFCFDESGVLTLKTAV